MRSRIGAICSLLALVAEVAAWNHISEARFRQALRNEYTLVAFVEPSQGVSQALEPEWVSIQETERDNNVVSLDCGSRPKLCDEFDVASFPAIRLFHGDGRVDRYRGARKASSIVAFLRRSLRPSLSYVDDKNATSFISVDDVVFVAHLAPGDNNLRERFENLAMKYRDRFSFGIGLPQRQSALACFNNLDDEQHSTTDLVAVEALENFVGLCSRPLIAELTRRNEMEYLNLGKSLVHYFITDEEERQAYLREMRPLAKKYQEYLAFTTIDAKEYPDMLPALGLTGGAKNALSVQNPSNGDVFPYTGKHKVTLPVVESFLADIIQGNVKPWRGSEPGGAEAVRHEEL